MTRPMVAACLVLAAILTMPVSRTAAADWADPCAGFVGYDAAEVTFLADGGPELDVDLLDLDGDGYPCEGLSGSPAAALDAEIGVYPRGQNHVEPMPGWGEQENDDPMSPSAAASAASASVAASDLAPTDDAGGRGEPSASASGPAGEADATDDDRPTDEGHEAGDEAAPSAVAAGSFPAVLADAVSLRAAWVIDAGRDGTVSFFGDTGADEAMGVDAMTPEYGMAVAVIAGETGAVVDEAMTGPDGTVTLDAPVDAPFTVVITGTGQTSPAFDLSADMTLGVLVALYTAGTPGVTDPTVTDPAVTDPAAAELETTAPVIGEESVAPQTAIVVFDEPTSATRDHGRSDRGPAITALPRAGVGAVGTSPGPGSAWLLTALLAAVALAALLGSVVTPRRR